MFLLDTNVVSELRKVGDGRADPGVMAWLDRTDAAICHVSALTLMELEIGILRIARTISAHSWPVRCRPAGGLRKTKDGRLVGNWGEVNSSSAVLA